MGAKLTKWMWRFFIGGILFFILTIVAINLGALGYMPSISELENPESNEASVLYAADGEILGKYFFENRSAVTYSKISPNLINALVATEDERFFAHSGIDGRALLRAVFNLGKKGGGSTLTQQLAKNLFPRQNVNMFTLVFIKLKEWVTAVKLETNLTKNEIITLYLNTVPFGGNIYGIKTAANTFFAKEPSELTIDESAILVGMLKANTRYNPRRNPEKSKGRRNVVLQKMVDNNFLSQSEAEKFKALPISLRYKELSHHESAAPYFRQTIEQEIKQWAKKHKKEDGTEYNIYKDGLKIYTTLDIKMQKHAEDAVHEHLKYMQSIFNTQRNIRTGRVWKKKIHANVLKGHIERSDRYLAMKNEGKSHSEIMKVFNTATKMKVFSYKNEAQEIDTIMTPLDSIKYMRQFLQSGFMVMDPYTGEVKAWVGGINHKFFQFDHVNITTKRQVGSTIKPFVYCLAIDNGISPCSSISTRPQKFVGQRRYYNAGGSRYGAMRMDNALANSVNNASLYLLKQVGISNFIDFVKKTGISSEIVKVPSIALGVSDISVYEMLWGYTMFPNQGINTKPVMITKIEDRYGNVIASFYPEQKEVISKETAYKMVKMMQGVVNKGTGKGMRSYGLKGQICGKTGTTNSQADAWFMSYTPQYLAGAWVGCDDRFLRFNSTAIGQGAKAALPIIGRFFKKIKKDPNIDYDESAKFDKPKKFDYCGVDYRQSGSYGGTYYNRSSYGRAKQSEKPSIATTNEENNEQEVEVPKDKEGNVIEEVPVIEEVSSDEWVN